MFINYGINDHTKPFPRGIPQQKVNNNFLTSQESSLKFTYPQYFQNTLLKTNQPVQNQQNILNKHTNLQNESENTKLYTGIAQYKL